MPRVSCSICLHDNLAELERLGLEALDGKRSWRSAEDEGGIIHSVALKNHMEKHYVAPSERDADERKARLDAQIMDAVDDLLQQMSVAPADIKPLYALAIQNLRGIEDTKPSQQHLIMALKAIHEIQGLKSEHAHLLQYAAAIEVQEAKKPEAIEA